ncbi:KRAB-A domain-containing protein 2 [Trichonephila clavipes]|nr:KRAB-A domain-containing protein 2 [Trichonephila clavipes]
MSGREIESSNASNKNVTYLRKKIAPAQIDDIARIQVPDNNRGRTDNLNVLAVVVGIEDFDFYKLAVQKGTLKQLGTCNQFVICKEKLLSIFEIYFQEMSLRVAATANSRSARQSYTRCHCKRKCSTNKCSCKSKSFLCHNTLASKVKEAKTRHRVSLVLAHVTTLEEDLKQHPLCQDSPKDVLSDSGLEIELAIPFVPNRDPPDTPQQSELSEVMHYHPSE